MSSNPDSPVLRLAETAAALRKGENFPVTRLTVLKRLCQDVRGGTRFLVYLAAAARDQMGREQQRRRGGLSELLDQVSRVQDTYEPGPWGGARIIINPSLLVVEDALRGVLSPAELPHWAYRAARQYAERDDPRFPGGFVPKSAPRVDEGGMVWEGAASYPSLQAEN